MSVPGAVYIFFSCIMAVVLAVLILLMTAHFSLPVRTVAEGWRVARWIVTRIFGRVEPAVFVQEGQVIPFVDTKDEHIPELALIDLTSALVLSASSVPKTDGQHHRRSPKNEQPTSQKSRLRVAGPGMVFISNNESIVGAVGLRSQVRFAPGVLCRTSDGIEFKTTVSVVFSLIQPPAIIYLGYKGNRAEDLRVLKINRQTGMIEALSDELEDQDKAEVYVFHRSHRADNSPSTQLARWDVYQEYPPYKFNDFTKKRIASAASYHPLDVYGRARDGWTDLPLEEAIRIFRNMLSRVTFDELYVSNRIYQFPLADSFKPRFMWALRNQGVLSYQLVRPIDGALLEPGQIVDEINFQIFPVQDFTSQTILRERGIKVIFAGFSDLDPSETIKDQLLDNWRARWQRKVGIERANQDLELMRLKNRSRAEAQRAMVFQLSQILQSTPHSEEALTMRIFQALENAATDPTTRQLLPGDAIAMLQSIRQWLLPGEQSPE